VNSLPPTPPVSPSPKPIETHYAGCRFRSRLEARWAVFFNALEIAWEYEPQGYVTPEGMYLPDFFLPDFEKFAEVKPKKFSEHEYQMAASLPEPCLLLVGPPAMKFYSPARLFPDDVPREERVIDDYIFSSGHLYNAGAMYLDAWQIHCGLLIARSGSVPKTGTAQPIHELLDHYLLIDNPVLQAAVNKARSARFEHGESG